MTQAHFIDPHRLVQPWRGSDQQHRCKFQCQYCFAADPDYLGTAASRDDYEAELNSPELDVVMLSNDTELFLNRSEAMQAVQTAVAAGKSLTFATKMILSDDLLLKLQEFQHELAKARQVLCVMVSLPCLDSAETLEPNAPSPHARVAHLKRLRNAGLLPFVGIRPILPGYLVSDEEIEAIIQLTVEDALGYIIGPYWFRTDIFGVMNHPECPVTDKTVEWMKGNPTWHVYEDKAREARVSDMIRRLGGTIYERSSEAVRAIRRDQWGE
ncbi:MAG: hypothetical protein LKI24_11840 [Acidipropionibacterium sp.]|jgi:DNA repair photolyase|nr:hypothetical protein [Acidipropionibacterium sp.]